MHGLSHGTLTTLQAQGQWLPHWRVQVYIKAFTHHTRHAANPEKLGIPLLSLIFFLKNCTIFSKPPLLRLALPVLLSGVPGGTGLLKPAPSSSFRGNFSWSLSMYPMQGATKSGICMEKVSPEYQWPVKPQEAGTTTHLPPSPTKRMGEGIFSSNCLLLCLSPYKQHDAMQYIVLENWFDKLNIVTNDPAIPLSVLKRIVKHMSTRKPVHKCTEQHYP